jgi:hypothetical protein
VTEFITVIHTQLFIHAFLNGEYSRLTQYTEVPSDPDNAVTLLRKLQKFEVTKIRQ